MSIVIKNSKKNTLPPSPKAPDEVVALEDQDFFGPAPLIPGEDPLAYETLFRRFTKMLRPKDVLEEIWARDLADLTWEIYRLRRLRENVFQNYARNRVSGILEKSTKGEDLLQRWMRGEAEALEEVDKRLFAQGLSMHGLTAEALVANLGAFECIDRMLAGAEARRNRVRWEVERHKDSVFAKSLREFNEVQSDGFIGVDYDEKPVP